jgi:hypothetical protein
MQQSKSDGDPFRLPKRSLSIAFAAGSIILFLFIAFAGFSATQIQFHVGNPSYSVNGENFVISVPVNISNNGLFDLQNLEINSTVFEGGVELFNSTTLISSIEPNSEATFAHNLTVNLPDFLEGHRDLLFDDSELRAAESVCVVLASLFPAGVDFNSTYSWGAPLNGFNASNLLFQPINSTTVQVSLDVAFNNHATFSLEGNVTLSAFSGAEQVAVQTLQLSVGSGGSFSSPIRLLLPTTVQVSRVSITVQTGLFSWEENVYG